MQFCQISNFEIQIQFSYKSCHWIIFHACESSFMTLRRVINYYYYYYYYYYYLPTLALWKTLKSILHRNPSNSSIPWHTRHTPANGRSKFMICLKCEISCWDFRRIALPDCEQHSLVQQRHFRWRNISWQLVFFEDWWPCQRTCNPSSSRLPFSCSLLDLNQSLTATAHSWSMLMTELYSNGFEELEHANTHAQYKPIPDVWNKLPCHLSSTSALPAFRKRLKHHLFSIAFLGISSPSTGITLCDVTTTTNVNHIRSIVGSRLICFNSLLTGTSVSNLARLQLVQNTLARVVAQKSCFCHITPVLADLHWLPVHHRMNFKISTIVFEVLHFQLLSYLAALVPWYVPTRSLRSSSSLSICIPSWKTAMARSKFFSSVALDTWNKLPCHLSSISALPAFRKRHKHHLFSSAFPGISSPSTDITFCDIITSLNVNHTRCTLPPS